MARRHKHSGGSDHAAAPVRNAEELRQVDLSHLRIQEMTPGQRAELRRRYDAFIRHFGRSGTALPPVDKARIKKWTPGAKR
jgi:hypothetical protein